MYTVFNHGAGQVFLREETPKGVFIGGRKAIYLEDTPADFELAMKFYEMGNPVSVSGGAFDENSQDNEGENE